MLHKPRAVSRIFLLGGPRAKPESLRRAPKVRCRGPPPENFEKLDALKGVFPPSQKLKDIPTKCTFWVYFVGKPYVVIKEQFSHATKGLSQDGDEIFGLRK
jgi:hypothetical protein